MKSLLSNERSIMQIKMLTAALALAVIAGCSAKTPPSFGEQLAEKSAETDAIAKKWRVADAKRQKGLRLMEEGKEDLADAQKDMNEANRDIQKGQQLVVEAEAAMREAEADMRAIRAKPIDIPSTPLTIQPAADK